MSRLNILSGGAAQGLVGSLAPAFKERTGFDIAGGRVRGVQTSRGTLAADRVVMSVAGHASVLAQRAGLEWLFRLATEPKRLWKRYAKHNPRFVFLFARQLVQQRRRSKETLPVTREEAGR